MARNLKDKAEVARLKGELDAARSAKKTRGNTFLAARRMTGDGIRFGTHVGLPVLTERMRIEFSRYVHNDGECGWAWVEFWQCSITDKRLKLIARFEAKDLAATDNEQRTTDKS